MVCVLVIYPLQCSKIFKVLETMLLYGAYSELEKYNEGFESRVL